MTDKQLANNPYCEDRELKPRLVKLSDGSVVNPNDISFMGVTSLPQPEATSCPVALYLVVKNGSAYIPHKTSESAYAELDWLMGLANG